MRRGYKRKKTKLMKKISRSMAKQESKKRFK